MSPGCAAWCGWWWRPPSGLRCMAGRRSGPCAKSRSRRCAGHPSSGARGSTGAACRREPRTLPVAESASEADGLLELRVMAGGRPVSRAQVRLYRRSGRIPETGRVDWRVAAGGATGNDGQLLMPARAGAYLVVARAEGLAPAWLRPGAPIGRDRGRPAHPAHGGAAAPSGARRCCRTRAGRCAGAELTLTPDVSPWEQDVHADAPAEERVTVTSDSTGASGWRDSHRALHGGGAAPGSPLRWSGPSGCPRSGAPGAGVAERCQAALSQDAETARLTGTSLRHLVTRGALAPASIPASALGWGGMHALEAHLHRCSESPRRHGLSS